MLGEASGNFYDLTWASVRGPERTDPRETRRETYSIDPSGWASIPRDFRLVIEVLSDSIGSYAGCFRVDVN